MMHDAPISPLHYEGSDLEVLAAAPNYQAWIAQVFTSGLRGRVVEFGAGLGAMSRLIRPHATRLDLVEPSTNLAEALRQRFDADSAVAVFPATLEDFAASTPAETYDGIVLVNVLEHIEDDGAAARAFLRLLKPGGTLFVFVPALPWLYSALDRQVGHFRRYTKPGLTRLMRDAGFLVEEVRYFDLLGVLPWWVLNTLGGKTDFNPTMVRLYDRVGVPVTRTAEGIIDPPLGKNVYCLARKPG